MGGTGEGGSGRERGGGREVARIERGRGTGKSNKQARAHFHSYQYYVCMYI